VWAVVIAALVWAMDGASQGAPTSPVGSWSANNPLPFAGRLMALWGSDPRDVWVHGTRGALLHWDGARWTRWTTPFGDRVTVERVWRSAGTLWAWVHWSPLASPVDRPSPESYLLSWTGSSWTRYRRSGPGWERSEGPELPWMPFGETPAGMKTQPTLPTIAPATLPAVDGQRAEGIFRFGRRIGSEIWAVRSDGSGVGRHDGQRWTMTTRLTGAAFWRVRPAGGRGWAIAAWRQPRADGAAVRDDEADALFGGQAGRWSLVHRTARRPHALWAGATGEVWVGEAGGLIVRREGDRWQPVPLPAVRSDVGELAGPSLDGLWVHAGGDLLLRRNGKGWERLPSPLQRKDRASIARLWGPGRAPTWAAGRGFLDRYVDGRWRSQAGAIGPLLSSDGRTARFTIAALWGGGEAELWAVGWVDAGGHGATRPLVLSWNGREWQRVEVPRREGALHGVWGDGKGRLWVVGAGGIILRREGSTWVQEESPSALDLRDISGDGSALWIAGDEGTLLSRPL
jgi:hypothetical protein